MHPLHPRGIVPIFSQASMPFVSNFAQAPTNMAIQALSP